MYLVSIIMRQVIANIESNRVPAADTAIIRMLFSPSGSSSSAAKQIQIISEKR